MGKVLESLGIFMTFIVLATIAVMLGLGIAWAVFYLFVRAFGTVTGGS